MYVQKGWKVQSWSSSPQNITLMLQKGYSSEEFVNYTMTLCNHISQRALCNDNITGPPVYQNGLWPRRVLYSSGVKRGLNIIFEKKKKKRDVFCMAMRKHCGVKIWRRSTIISGQRWEWLPICTADKSLPELRYNLSGIFHLVIES